MTDQERKAMEMALEALEQINQISKPPTGICLPAEIDTAMDVLRQALAQPEQELENEAIKTISNAIDYLYSTKGEAKNVANQAHLALKRLQINLRDQTVLHLLYKGDYEDLLAQPEQNKRVCNTCNGTGIVKGLHNWAGGGKRTESCWACHEVAQPDPRPEWMKGDPDINKALERASQILAQSEKKQTHNLVHEIDLVLTDPDTSLSVGAQRALQYVSKQLQVTTPPSKEWVSLTDDEIDYLEDAIDPAMYRVFARRIEAKLKELNT